MPKHETILSAVVEANSHLAKAREFILHNSEAVEIRQSNRYDSYMTPLTEKEMTTMNNSVKPEVVAQIKCAILILEEALTLKNITSITK